jgi:hypothetical protein
MGYFDLPSTLWEIEFKDGTSTEIIADGTKEQIKRETEERIKPIKSIKRKE